MDTRYRKQWKIKSSIQSHKQGCRVTSGRKPHGKKTDPFLTDIELQGIDLSHYSASISYDNQPKMPAPLNLFRNEFFLALL